jgi:hypothetical protein
MDRNAIAPVDSSALEHARYLAEVIGPRGSTTPQEVHAAEYARQVLDEAGLQPVEETFTSARSAWRPFALASALALMAEVLFLFAGQIGAVLASALMALVLGSVLLELAFQGNPLRWALPKGQSQNVWARLPAAGEIKQRVLLIGHLDTHRTPKLFSTPRWLSLLPLLAPASLGVVTLNTLFFVAGIFFASGWWRSLSMILALVPWWLSVLTFEADYTPYTTGAADNASGAGVVLSLAARLKQQPLQATEVWVLCSGCKEVGGYGAADFFARHRDELRPAGDEHSDKPGSAYCITFDSVGGAGTGPCYLTQESLLSTVHSDAGLVCLADEVAARRPELGAYRLAMAGTYTEGRIAAGAGLRVLTFFNLPKEGYVPHWRQPTDLWTNVDGSVVQNTEQFVWELLQALDQSPGPKIEP